MTSSGFFIHSCRNSIGFENACSPGVQEVVYIFFLDKLPNKYPLLLKSHSVRETGSVMGADDSGPRSG
jgi:hypothetical protein